jgi:hypothetical protein
MSEFDNPSNAVLTGNASATITSKSDQDSGSGQTEPQLELTISWPDGGEMCRRNARDLFNSLLQYKKVEEGGKSNENALRT